MFIKSIKDDFDMMYFSSSSSFGLKYKKLDGHTAQRNVSSQLILLMVDEQLSPPCVIGRIYDQSSYFTTLFNVFLK